MQLLIGMLLGAMVSTPTGRSIGNQIGDAALKKVTPRYCASSWTRSIDGMRPRLEISLKRLFPAPLSAQATVGLTPFNSQYFFTFCTKTSICMKHTYNIEIGHLHK